jgi:uncharacterized protein YegP (UPF0339 family)
MIQIKKNKKGLVYVSYIANNDEILATSESFKSKQSAWKNIIAMYKNFATSATSCSVFVHDMTVKKTQIYILDVVSKIKRKID